MARLNPDTLIEQDAVAIIGMSCRFPGAPNVQLFWQNLKDGVESISFFSDEELMEAGVDPLLLKDSNYVKAGAILHDIEWFDAQFFGYSPREARLIDVQHRLFLECAWEALEDAGYDPQSYKGLIAVFAGASTSSYLLYNIHANPDLVQSLGKLEIGLGNDLDYLATRVSYKLNLKGPSFTIQTSCSTSLVTVNMACDSLLSGQSDMAIAGGVSITLPQKQGYHYIEGEIHSPDGHCRAFDKNAQGTVFGNGIGVIVLKRLADALKDCDHIYAVIKGYAINNDGSAKVGFTAPSVEGQAQVIGDALAMSRIDPGTITYVETHGTGTALGDPIEIAALTQAFRESAQKECCCAIGSVKTNIGHMYTAAGVASLIKTVLALQHRMVPPSLNFKEPNAKIDFASSPFYVNTKLSEWKVDGFPRRAGVSSFGVGGTNAHCILEEAPTVGPSAKSRRWQVLVLSAQSSTGLDKATTNLISYLKLHPDVKLADVAYTLNIGRKTFDHRQVIVCQNVTDAVSALDAADPNRVVRSCQQPTRREVVFLFPGQGSQYVNMALELYRTELQFQQQIDHCSEIFRPLLGLDLRDTIYPAKENGEQAAQRLKQTSITQPALFTIEYALAKLWMSWGVHPTALVGHSIGEYVAACLAGVFSLEEAVSLVAARGRLINELPSGSMLAVSLSEEEIRPFLDNELSLSAVNSSSFCVVSGKAEAIWNLVERLSEKNFDCRELHTSHAFHSSMMEPILEAFTEQAKRVHFHTPHVPILSTVTGTWIAADEIMAAEYWARNLRRTVRFSDCVQELLKEPSRVFLEVGPGQTLSTFVRQHSSQLKEHVVVSSVRHPKDERSDVAFILKTLGRLWLAGIQLDWSGFYKNERRHRLSLPTYPFERQRHWVEPQIKSQDGSSGQKPFHEKLPIGEWLYLPSWKRSLMPKLPSHREWKDRKLCWLVFMDECDLGSKLVAQLERYGQEVIAVQAGREFGPVDGERYVIDPQAKQDYDSLIQTLRTLGKFPQVIVHLWNVAPSNALRSGIESFNPFQALGFYSLVFLTQALARQGMTQSIDLAVVSTHLHEVTDERELICPEKAPLRGPCKVIPQEFANITCRSIDLDLGVSQERQIQQLLGELAARPTDFTVAFRGKHRWTQIFDPVKSKGIAKVRPRLKQEGTYIIIGGLGAIGLVFSEYLARTVQGKLVLTGRTGLPAKDEWGQWLEEHNGEDSVSRKIRRVKALEELGAEVLVVRLDVANEGQMQRMIALTEERFGGINGVIHAAGTIVESPIEELTPGLFEEHFHSKVNGLFVLERVLEGKALDFCLLTSSLSSVLGGIGYTGYTAANLFMDAFAHRHNQSHAIPWITVNWDAWQLGGGNGENLGQGSDLAALSIKPKEGWIALQHILSLDLDTQLVVSTWDLEARLDKWIKLQSLREQEQTKKDDVFSFSPRPSLSSDYVVAGNPTEQTIAAIWQELLGVEKVGIHDNFFELGGHSLLATRIIARLRQVFPVEFSAATLFERPTVHSLSKMILEDQDGESSFVESRRRGQRRKERRLQRMIPEKRMRACEGSETL